MASYAEVAALSPVPQQMVDAGPEDYTAYIPPEILALIFQFAGTDIFFILKLVCKRWRDVLFDVLHVKKTVTPLRVVVQNIPLMDWVVSTDESLGKEYLGSSEIRLQKARIQRALEKHSPVSVVKYLIDKEDIENYQRHLRLRANPLYVFYTPSVTKETVVQGPAIIQRAASTGDLELFKLVSSRNAFFPEYLKGALVNGHFEIIKCAFEKHYDKFRWYQRLDFGRWAFEGGNVEILRILYKHKIIFDKDDVFVAAEKGHFHAVVWAYTTVGPHLVDEITMNTALKHGHFNIAQWINERHYPYNIKSILCAIESGNLETAARVKEDTGYSFNVYMLYSAVSSGNKEMVDWVLAGGVELDGEAIVKACEKFDLEMIQYLRQKGCSWSAEATLFAFEKEDKTLFKWLVQNGCPVRDTDKVLVNCQLRLLRDVAKEYL